MSFSEVQDPGTVGDHNAFDTLREKKIWLMASNRIWQKCFMIRPSNLWDRYTIRPWKPAQGIPFPPA
jgi:hypothetical protein